MTEIRYLHFCLASEETRIDPTVGIDRHWESFVVDSGLSLRDSIAEFSSVVDSNTVVYARGASATYALSFCALRETFIQGVATSPCGLIVAGSHAPTCCRGRRLASARWHVTECEISVVSDSWTDVPYCWSWHTTGSFSVVRAPGSLLEVGDA